MTSTKTVRLPRAPQVRGFENRRAPAITKPGGGEKSITAVYNDGRRRKDVGASMSMRIGTVNVGTMSRREGEVSDMLERRGIDICCLQETRWKGGSARMLGGYKFYWVGGKDGLHGVGLMVAREWVDRVIEVKRVSERMMVLRMSVGKVVLNVVSVYAPQAGRPGEEREEFYGGLGRILSGVADEEMLVVCGDLNGHVGEKVDGFEGVHGGKGFGTRNLAGEMLLEFVEARGMVIANTWFDKEDAKKVSYESGGCKTVVDYVLVRKREQRNVIDVKVIPGEACLTQHKLMICTLIVSEQAKTVKSIFVSRCKVWRLKDEATQKRFRDAVQVREGVRDKAEETVESVWGEFKECLLEVANDVCGRTRGPPRHRESWWWDEVVADAVKEKGRLYRIMKKSKVGGDKGTLKADSAAYKAAKCISNQAVSRAKEAERQKLGESLDTEDGKGNLFRVVKQMVRKNKDVVGGGCVKDIEGKIVVEEEKIKEVWRNYFEKLSNEEFSWDKESLGTENVVNGPGEEITCQEVRTAVAKMKRDKAAGPSEVVAEMLKGSGESGIRWMTDLFNAIVREGKIPTDWCKSWIVSIYKGKGDAMECGSYRGIKLLEHVMKVLERVLESRLRGKVKIDDMQFGFSGGKGTTDAIFIVRQMQEKYLAVKKELWMAFVDLEKAFDRVPREVLWWAMRELGVEEWLINVIKSMYVGATTAVKVKSGESSPFEVKVGVHQGSVLSPFLFIIVLEALSRKFRGGLPYELLYADDLVLMAESQQLLLEKFVRWKEGMEAKGLRVNMGKTKVMKCGVETGQLVSSGKWPCGVCREGVRGNSILCTVCKKWVHKRCSGIKGRLKVGGEYKCPVCDGLKAKPDGSSELKEIRLGQDGRLECVDRFCYLGDMIGAGGGAEDAARTRVKCAWGKFNELAPILTSRGASLKLKGKIYRSCVQSVLVYGSETWPMKAEDMQRLERTEMAMVRWMCGVTLRDRVRSEDLRERLGVEGVTEMVSRGRLRWFGHLERKEEEDWASACRNVKVGGKVGRGRARKTWSEVVNDDMRRRGLKRDMAKDRAEWRSHIRGNRPTRASTEKRTLRR
jgi:hypothetical protein